MTESFEQLARSVAAELASRSGLETISLHTERHKNVIRLTMRPSSGTNEAVFPYSQWHDDLSQTPDRSLRTWSRRLVRRIFAYLPKDWNQRLPVSFYWITGNGSHSVGTSASLAFPIDEQTGEYITDGSLRHGGVLVCCEHCIAILDGARSYVYPLDEIDDLALEDVHESGSIEFHCRNENVDIELHGRYDGNLPADVLAYFSEDRFPPYREMFKSNDVQRIYAHADRILSSKSKRAYHYLILLAYFKKQDFPFVCEVAKRGATQFDLSLELLDSATPAFLKTGRFSEQLDLFNQSVHTILSVPGTDRCTLWMNLVGNTLVSVCMADAAVQNEFARQYYFEDAREEWGPSGRLFYHNFACLFARLSDYGRWCRALELAREFGENKDQIEGEEDFAPMLATSAGRQFVDQLLSREGRFSQSERRLTMTDLIRQRGAGENHRLVNILKEKTPEAIAYARDILQQPFASNMDRQECFFALLGADGEENLRIAREAYERYGVHESWDFYPGFTGLNVFYSDAARFAENARSIMGSDADFLIEEYLNSSKQES